MIKVILITIIMLMTSCSTAPAKGCGYYRSQQKKLMKYHRHHKHHSR
jgi:hypothetical protein